MHQNSFHSQTSPFLILRYNNTCHSWRMGHAYHAAVHITCARFYEKDGSYSVDLGEIHCSVIPYSSISTFYFVQWCQSRELAGIVQCFCSMASYAGSRKKQILMDNQRSLKIRIWYSMQGSQGALSQPKQLKIKVCQRTQLELNTYHPLVRKF